jgi:[acyl-carrier-protein] S-malonyltransferase
MGKLMAQQFPEARRTFEEADDVLAFPISRLCFEGPEEELKQTENTQPALVATSIAAFRVLGVRGIWPALVAGHSLGEYSALVAAGSLRFSDALRLVRNRGRYMQQAVPTGVGAMAALLKLPEGKLEGILEEAAQGEIVSSANLNSPDQIVIAGHAAAVARAMQLAKIAGARRAVLLPVSAPFHCPLMRPAQEQLWPELERTEFRDLAMPLVNNAEARMVCSGSDARRGLYLQIPNPVRWTESVRKMKNAGIRRFIEVGAGSVLLGLCRQIDPELSGRKVSEPADLEDLSSFAA